MRERAQHVALKHFSSISSSSRGLAAVLVSRSLGCDGGTTQDARQGLCLADGGPARPDVTLGTAETCLPLHLQSQRLSEGARLFETDGKSGTFVECDKKIKFGNQVKIAMQHAKANKENSPGKIFGARRPEDEGKAHDISEIVDCVISSSKEASAPKTTKSKEKKATMESPEVAAGTRSAMEWIVEALSPWSKSEANTPSTAVEVPREYLKPGLGENISLVSFRWR